MRKALFTVAMKAINAHSALLQAIGYTKWQVRDYSPLHHVLVAIASALA